MKRFLPLLIIMIALFSCAGEKENVCVLETTMGTMAFRFFEADAPVSCTHIQKLVGEGFYDGKD
ncbi:MAG: hypothetical protein GY863_21460, partial [bacterium]|nr:hypothetical protein [bacterium]